MDEKHISDRKNAIIAGVFVIAAAIIGGVFLLINTIVNHNLEITPAISTATLNLISVQTSASTPQSTIISPSATYLPTTNLQSVPTLMPTVNSPTLKLFQSNCVPSALWTPYEPDTSISNNNGCWDFSSWGLYAEDNSLQMTISASAGGVYHRIYLPISGNHIEIHFTLNIEKFELPDKTRTANIAIGLINTKPLGPASAALIYYHYIPATSTQYARLTIGQNGEYTTILPYVIYMETDQNVIIKIDEPLMTVIVNGQTYTPQNSAIPTSSILDKLFNSTWKPV